MPQIDPKTGEVMEQSGGVQIDPQTGEVMEQASAPADTRNGLQRAFDDVTTVTPEQEKGHSWLTNKAQEFGAGAIGSLSPIVHPLKALEGAGNAMAHPIDTIHNEVDDVRAHPAQFLGNLAGVAAMGGLAEEAPGGLKPFNPKGPGTIGSIAKAIPTRAKAGAVFEDLNKSLANQPVNLTQSTPELTQLEKIGASGPGVPTTVGKLLDRSRMISPMNYPEARLFQENLSAPSTTEKMGMGGSMKGGVKQLNKAFYGDIYDAANQAGRGEDYAKAMTDYRRAAQMNHAFKTAGSYAAKGAAGAAGAGLGLKFLHDLKQ